jgi:hypothetical protein
MSVAGCLFGVRSGPQQGYLVLTVTAVNDSSQATFPFTLPVSATGNILSLQNIQSVYFTLPAGFPTNANTNFKAILTVLAGSSATITLNGGSATMDQITGINVFTYDSFNRLGEVQQYTPTQRSTRNL